MSMVMSNRRYSSTPRLVRKVWLNVPGNSRVSYSGTLPTCMLIWWTMNISVRHWSPESIISPGTPVHLPGQIYTVDWFIDSWQKKESKLWHTVTLDHICKLLRVLLAFKLSFVIQINFILWLIYKHLMKKNFNPVIPGLDAANSGVMW